MSRRRAVNDGLPHRVYERHGLNVYSIGYKKKDGNWAFRLKCRISDRREIQKLRRDAIRRALSFSAGGTEIETVAQLIDDWFKWQEGLPAKSTRKRADTTLSENRREARNLRDVFGEMAIVDIKPHHGFSYLDKCDELSRGPKGNKEVSLFHTILQRAVRKGIIDVNPLAAVDKLPTRPSTRYVEDDELALAVEVGKRLGGQLHRAALALKVAHLCVRRSTETLSLKWSDVKEDGIHWKGAKKGATDFQRVAIIKWSQELRDAIDAVRTLNGDRRCAESDFVFTTVDGTRYTKGGWKATLRRLMEACEEQAQAEGRAFRKFSLQDQRPKGVTDKMEARHTDVVDATLHKNQRMVQEVYDRRRVRIAQPAR